MIGEAIQAALAVIIPNTFSSVADENTEAPFCVHTEKDTPEYLKEGISGYTWNCEIALINKTPDLVETNTMAIKTALESLQGTTSHGTVIETVSYEGSDQGFDESSRLYMKIIQFIINTKNR
jgi:hypothetical protein